MTTVTPGPSTMGPLSSSKDKSGLPLSSIRVHGDAMASDTLVMESLPPSPPNELDRTSVEEKDPIDPDDASSPEYLHGWRLAIVMLALLLSMFLV